MNYFEMIAPSLLRHAPELLGWLVGIILAVRILRQGSGKAEKLFMAGCSLMLAVQLVSPFLSGLVSLLLRNGWRSPQTPALILQLPVAVLGIAGFVCLVYAFWLVFWKNRQEAA